MAKQKKQRNKGDESKLEMSSMIDVVFQLLIFFVVTLKQDDIFSQLEALRPAPDRSMSKPSMDEPISFLIGKEGYFYDNNIRSDSYIREVVKRFARTNKDTMMIVKCVGNSQHWRLIKLLDMFAEYGLTKVSIFSM